MVFGIAHAGTDEQLEGEQAMPRILTDHAQREGVLRIGPDKAVLNEDVASVPEGLHAGIKTIELSLGHGLVHAAPLNGGVGDLVFDDEFVLGRPPGELSGADHQRAAAREVSFAPFDGLFHQPCGAKVPIGRVDMANPVVFEYRFGGADGVSYMAWLAWHYYPKLGVYLS